MVSVFVVAAMFPWLVTNRVSQQPETLRGGDASYHFVGKFSGAAAHLHLALAPSDMLDREHSTISVLLDGVPLVTQSLQQTGANLELDLGLPTAGFHNVAIDTHLRIAGLDTCSPDFLQQAWLVIEPTSTWTLQNGSERLSYRDALDRWFTRRGPVTVAIGDDTADLDTKVGYWQLDGALRKHGFVIERVPASAANGGLAASDVQVIIDPSLAANRVALQVNHENVIIKTASASQLGAAAQVLAFPELADACAAWPCEFGDMPPMAKTAAVADATAVRVGDVAPGGFRGAGPGEHRLLLRWQRPLDTTVLAGAELRLDVRTPPVIAAGRAIALDVELNGVVVETFELRAGGNTMHVPLALSATNRSAVEVAIVVRNLEPPNATCGQSEAELWAWIDPASALLIPRRIERYDGIASLVADWQNLPPLVITEALGWPDVIALAPMLAPIAQRFAAQSWRRTDACGSGCIVIRASQAQSVDVRALTHDAIRAPYKAPAQAMLLRKGTMLEMWAATEPVPSPDYASLLSRAALSNVNAWSGVGVANHVGGADVRAAPTREPANVTGRRERRRNYFVWVWSAISIVVLLGLSRVVSRAAK